jgi:hypothetical protein
MYVSQKTNNHQVSPHLLALASKEHILTLECLICALIPILVRVRKQTQLAVRFLNLAFRARTLNLLQTQNLIEGCRRTPFYPYDSGFLFDCEGSTCATVVVLVSTFGITIRLRIGAARFGGHSVRGCPG